MPATNALRRQLLGLFPLTPVLLALLVGAAAPLASGADNVAGAEDTPDLVRARREVKLLDDIYKSAIVLITTHYVDEASDLPAGKAFKVLFDGMKKKGWHEARLLDATGEPINEDNTPRDAFERNAVKALLAGKPYYEEQTTQDGKAFLRAATPIPIVMEKCTMCHENYRGQKVIGALGYTLPLRPDSPVR